MTPANTRPADTYVPQYFLASLGGGGLAVTFFMFLMFWVPHKGQAVPVFEDIAAALATASPLFSATIWLAMAGIAVFGLMNLALLVWNLRRVGPFLRSERGQAMMRTNAQSQIAAMPLALAMSLNTAFVLGLVFVPGLWGVVEYLFPLALLAYAAIAVMALRQTGAFLGRVIGAGGFNCQANNSLGQLLPAFALAMTGVGLAAPAAMSASATVVAISVIASTLVLVMALVQATVMLVLGLRSMFENGVNVEQAPTLLIVMPLITVVTILLLRQGHGLHVHLGTHGAPADTLVFLTRMLAVELGFGLFGLVVLRATGYLRRFVAGAETSAGSYALVCPGVALSVLIHFWVNKGLVGAGVIAKFGTAYWALTAPALLLQLAMILLLMRLTRRHFRRASRSAAIPAE